MRFERHARTRFISSKSTLVNFQQGWKKKPQVAMKLPDFCLAPLESSLLSKLLYPPPNPSVGCWDPRAWSVYHSKRPTYACAKNVAFLCLFYVVLTWAPLTTFQITLPTTAHTRYKVQFRPHSRAKTPPISWFSRLCRITFVNLYNRKDSHQKVYTTYTARFCISCQEVLVLQIDQFAWG